MLKTKCIYIFLISHFSTASFESQKITFVNEFGNPLVYQKLLLQNHLKNDTLLLIEKDKLFKILNRL